MDTTADTVDTGAEGVATGPLAEDGATTLDVIAVVTRTLGIEDRADRMTRRTGLFGELPELDSLGVVELAAALEDRFDIVIDDEDFTGEVFENVGTLADFVDARRGGVEPVA